jgi:hypothetical protein
MKASRNQKSRFLHRVYLWGYGGGRMPRMLRRMIAGSLIHRAWLLGWDGFFVEGDIQYGPANAYGLKG